MPRPPIHREGSPPPPYAPFDTQSAFSAIRAPPAYARSNTANSRMVATERNERTALPSVQVNIYYTMPPSGFTRRDREASRAARHSIIRRTAIVLIFALPAVALVLFLVLTAMVQPGPAEPGRHVYNWSFALAQRGGCASRGNQEFFARLKESTPFTEVSACLEASYSHDWPAGLDKPISCKRGWWYQYGYWHQPNFTFCTPYWNAAKPAECVSYATRRWFAELSNVHYDRRRACSETPIRFPSGTQLESPAACHLSRKGVWGEWLVRDDNDAECIPQWLSLRAGHCKIYGVREYIARLTNVNYSPWTACRDTPIEIHGHRQDKPHECRLNKHGEMEGVWHVTDEPYCRPHWGHVKNEGCKGAGYRRYASRLWGIRSASWAAMCQTTPIVLAGHTFPGAMRCVNKHVMGMWGQWMVPDENCVRFDDLEPDTDESGDS